MHTTFVLVHGAFGTPAELAPAVPGLEAAGHRVVNVDLPCEDPDATLTDYANAVVVAMRDAEPPRFLVGHSAGGGTIALAAARVPVDRLVFVTALVPEPGRSLLESAGAEVREALAAVTVDHGDGTLSFDLESLADMAPPDAREAMLLYLRQTQRRQGWRAMTEPWPGDSIPDVPRSYVLCTEDTLVPPARQRAFASSLGVEPIEIASDHSVFALEPERLAAILASLAD